MNTYETITHELTDFIAASPSCYHAIRNLAGILEANGFTRLREEEAWKLTAGGSYYTVRSDSSLIAFALPSGEAENYQLIASHSDSPTFRIKENPEILRDGSYTELNVEKYGGMLCAPWFDRPLSIAGRVLIREGDLLKTRLVHFDRDLVMLPSLAIHMNRQANEGASYRAQSDMLPLFGDGEAAGSFRTLLAQELSVEPETIAARDLFLYPRTAPSFWGAHGEFFSSPRLDDLQCAYSSVRALCRSRNDHSVRVCCVFDNEEVGSQTKQGANSTFLEDVLERISDGLGCSREMHQRMIRSGFMVSADNAHAVHPNHLDKADPTHHPHMNQGVVIKFSANQKYTTDGVSAAIFRTICSKAGIPTQDFVNHSDIPGGSTLGNISNSHISMNTVDIGAPQLAMHSPYETGGIRDTWYLAAAMEAFYSTSIRRNSNGDYHISVPT